MNRSHQLLLVSILAGACLLRLPCLRWGLPPAVPHVAASDFRCSYAFDEDDVLTAVSFMNPSKLEFEPRLYRWGTLHFSVLLGWLSIAEDTGYIGSPWRDAYYNLRTGSFDRVYAAARCLSALVGLLAIVLVFMIGLELGSPAGGLWAALLTALSPAHLLASTQARVDMTMVCLALVTAWLALRSCRDSSLVWPLAAGAAAALAITAKYTACFVVVPILGYMLWNSRFAWRTVLVLLTGFSVGALLGQPQLLTRWDEITRQISQALANAGRVPPRLRMSLPELFQMQVLNANRFVLGPVGFGLSIWGGWKHLWRGTPAARVVLLCLAGGIIGSMALVWPLVRYQLPVLPFAALAAGLAISRLHWSWGAIAAIFPFAASLAQVGYMMAPHPANRALALILATVPPGTPISRLTVEMPPLDRKIYPTSQNPFLDDLTADPPQWVLTADLPYQSYPAANRQLLRDRYDRVASFESTSPFAWVTFGDSVAPHDWKYTHVRLVLYQKRPIPPDRTQPRP